MSKKTSYQIVTAGLFLALGLVLPYATAHAFGIPGTILLPMHIPVLLCGLLCGPRFGAINGILIPLLSSLLTGMPPAYPMLPIMAAQLFAMGLLSGLLHQTLRRSLHASLIGSMVAGWVVYGGVYGVLLFSGSGTLKALSVPAALAKGIPGIIIQLILIPILVVAVHRYQQGKGREAQSGDETGLDQALALLKSGQVSCVVLRDGQVVHQADGRGVSPLLNLYGDAPETMKDAFVVDKIIGKAAAMILVLGGAREAYGVVMSVAARDYLQQHGIAVQYGRCVDVITARDEKGICPIEKSVLDVEDPQQGLKRIKETLSNLKQQAG